MTCEEKFQQFVADVSCNRMKAKVALAALCALNATVPLPKEAAGVSLKGCFLQWIADESERKVALEAALQAGTTGIGAEYLQKVSASPLV